MAAASMTADAAARFLDARTPRQWVDEACARIPELLQDHANCELKAASTALGLIYRYPVRTSLVQRMSRLAREELRHFEQVRKLLDDLSIPFVRLSASRYAATLMQAVRKREPERLLDTLLVGALIEARSCERFAALVPRVAAPLNTFYGSLLASEARHFAHYLDFARTETAAGAGEFDRRLTELKGLETTLISEPDPQFRFHSGPPAVSRQANACSGGGPFRIGQNRDVLPEAAGTGSRRS